MAWIKKHLFTLILVLILIIGAGLLIYPSLANYINTMGQSKTVQNYAADVAKMSDDEYEKVISDAEAYNSKIAQSGFTWDMTDEQKTEYESLLNVSGTGVMGYLTIPKIDLQLPIYHGTSDEVLKTSIGHVEGTSLPVGGSKSHCVLSGHRGLPSARLFTDLDKMAEGDTFTLSILNETLTYEVDQIRIVLPEDLSSLTLEDGQDYCTLVTCTPYGVNTHRLLVRGHRIANADGDARIVADALQIEPIYIVPFACIPFVAALLIVLFVTTGKKYRKRHESKVPKYLKEKGIENRGKSDYKELIRRSGRRRFGRKRGRDRE